MRSGSCGCLGSAGLVAPIIPARALSSACAVTASEGAVSCSPCDLFCAAAPPLTNSGSLAFGTSAFLITVSGAICEVLAADGYDDGLFTGAPGSPSSTLLEAESQLP